jgi:threonine synthase
MSLDHVRALSCTACGESYDPDQLIYTCPHHKGVTGILEGEYNYDEVLDNWSEQVDGIVPSQWKYRAFLPVHDDADPVTLNEGGTELYEAPNLSERIGVDILVKADSHCPTGVLKDRASSVAVTKLRRERRHHVCIHG